MLKFAKKAVRGAVTFVQDKAGNIQLSHAVGVVRGAGIVGLSVGSAMAASVLDTATTTAITSGFTDMKDTVLGLLGVAWPFLIAVPVIMAAPRIVSRLVKMIAH